MVNRVIFLAFLAIMSTPAVSDDGLDNLVVVLERAQANPGITDSYYIKRCAALQLATETVAEIVGSSELAGRATGNLEEYIKLAAFMDQNEKQAWRLEVIMADVKTMTELYADAMRVSYIQTGLYLSRDIEIDWAFCEGLGVE